MIEYLSTAIADARRTALSRLNLTAKEQIDIDG
jgi:hypothetical protein